MRWTPPDWSTTADEYRVRAGKARAKNCAGNKKHWKHTKADQIKARDQRFADRKARDLAMYREMGLME